MTEVLTFQVKDDQATRLDKFLTEATETESLSLSRERLKELIQRGYVKVNQSTLTKPSHKLSPQDQVT